jgi:UDP-N-acetyl-2-amino-2-deoxyglucuronate dehydrogenase
MQSKNLGIAFIGCGRVAQWQAKFFEGGIEGVSVVSVCDSVEEKALEMASRFNAEAKYDYAEVLAQDNVDIVSIMTESGYHFEHAKQALLAGKHVIVEKPPCMFPEQIIELRDLAVSRNLMYAPIFQNRYNPAIKVLKQAVDDGRFGKLVCASVRLFWCRYQDYYEDGWHGTWRMDGGVLNQQAIHHVDAMQWICGEVDSVNAVQANRLNDLEAEDTTVATVKFENGALGTIEVTTAARPEDMDASLTLVGELGSATIGGVALNEVSHWKFVDSHPDDVHIPSQYSTEVPNGYGYSHGPLIEDIVRRIREGKYVAPIAPESAAQTVRLIHSLYRSAEDSAVVQLRDDLRSRKLGAG